MAAFSRKSTLGTIIKKSGKYQARYMKYGQYHTSGALFFTPQAADRWLLDEESLIDKGLWTPPETRRARKEAKEVTLGDYLNDWITHRTTKRGKPLAESTQALYRSYVDGPLAPLAGKNLTEITRAQVQSWWDTNTSRPKTRKEAYSLMKTAFKKSVADGLVDENPCQVENASARVRKVSTQQRGLLISDISVEEMIEILAAYDRPHFRLALTFCAWCGLRPSEALALKRGDLRHKRIDGTTCWSIDVTRTIEDGADKQRKLAEPKTPESVRRVLVPPHLNSQIVQHLATYPTELLFPSTNPDKDYATLGQLRGANHPPKYTGWLAIKHDFNRPELRIYDLRHWARMIWTRAGLDYPSVEMMLGHRLPEVVGTYAHFDPAHVWPYAIKVSEMAGWLPDAGE